MGKLLKVELFKLRKSRTVIIVSIILWGLAAFSAGDIQNGSGEGIRRYGYMAPFLGAFLFSIMSSFCYAVLCCVQVGNEYQYGTIRNELGIGVNRKQYYFAKLLVLCFVNSMYVFGMMAIFTLIRTIEYGFMPSTGTFSLYGLKLLLYVVGILFQIWAYTSVFVMIAFAIKNGAVSSALCIIIVFLESYIGQQAQIRENKWLSTILDNVPGMAIRVLYTDFVEMDRILTWDFALSLIPALIMICISVVIGCYCFAVHEVR